MKFAFEIEYDVMTAHNACDSEPHPFFVEVIDNADPSERFLVISDAEHTMPNVVLRMNLPEARLMAEHILKITAE